MVQLFCRICGDTEEFPDECAPPDLICDSCWALMGAQG